MLRVGFEQVSLPPRWSFEACQGTALQGRAHRWAYQLGKRGQQAQQSNCHAASTSGNGCVGQCFKLQLLKQALHMRLHQHHSDDGMRDGVHWPGLARIQIR